MNISKDYQLLIYAAGGTSAGVEHTIASTMFRSAPTVGGQRIEPLKGRAQSVPTVVEILDSSTGFFAEKVSDSDGRPVLIRRVGTLQVSVDGSTFQDLYTGRITSVNDDVSHFNVTIHDERVVERNTDLFTAVGSAIGNGSTADYVGTRLVPPGIDGGYGKFVHPASVPFFRANRDLNQLEGLIQNNMVFMFFDALVVDGIDTLSHRDTVAQETYSLIRDDIKEETDLDYTTTQGNFVNLRARIDGVDREVHSFRDQVSRNSNNIFGVVELMEQGRRNYLSAWVVFSTYGSSDISEAVLYMPDAEPTRHMPLHIGGTGQISGMDPIDILEDVYDEIGVRYSTGALDTLRDPGFIRTNMRFRIDRPHLAGRWLEENIYQPLQIIPFVDGQGRLAPRSVRLPVDQQSTSFFEFIVDNTTASNVSLPHPAWENMAREQVTKIRQIYTQETEFPFTRVGDIDANDFSADLLESLERELTYDHDRITEFGTFEEEIKTLGLHTARTRSGLPGAAKFVGQFVATEYFERFGDGVMRGTLSALSTGEDVEPGDFVRVTIPTFMNVGSQARGGTRIVQIVSKTLTPSGPEFEWLDAGPNSQPISTPTVTLSSSTRDGGRHEIVATITTTSDSRYQLQLAESATEPASTSSDWFPRLDGSTANLSPRIGSLKSNTTYWARVRASKNSRIRSAYSTAPNQATAAITAPSALASSSITATTVQLDWTLGSTQYGTNILLDETTTCTSTTPLRRVVGLAPGGDEWLLQGLTADTTHCVGVRHFDQFGGFSETTQISLETDSTQPDAPPLLGLTLIAGSTC